MRGKLDGRIRVPFKLGRHSEDHLTQRISDLHLAVAALATSGDAGGLYRLVARLLDEGTALDAVLFDVLIPVEREVGHRWQRGEYLVAEEHAVTATIETVVSLLAGALEQPSGGERVVVATVEGDAHSLPARAAAAHLLFAGYQTTFLGANVLSSDLAEFLSEERPDALVLSSAMTIHLLGARAGVEAGHAAGVPVLVGGRGFGADGRWARSVGADAWVPTLREIVPTLGSWTPDPVAAQGGAATPGPELLALVERRSHVRAQVEEEWVGRFPEAHRSEVREEIETLIGAVEAALLVDDPDPLAEAIQWQASALPIRGFQRCGELADALAAALAETLPEAAAMVASARDELGPG